MAACSSVFVIPELLQNIIAELPPLDIIRSQRVNRIWHTLITDTPLLQYKAWLRNDFPDAGQHGQPHESIPEPDSSHNFPFHSKDAQDYNNKQYLYNIQTYLHPVIVAKIMQDIPEDCSYSFNPFRDMSTHGFGGFLSFRPVLLRALRQWYLAHKNSEDKWGHISLYRPNSRYIDWDVPCSDDSGIPFSLEARRCDTPEARRNHSHWLGNKNVVDKPPGEPLILTLSDLLVMMDLLWNRWIDSERETHYLSHDGQGCDYDRGLPDYCLDSSDEDEDQKGRTRVKFGCKMTAEEHLDDCVMRASSK